MVQIDPQGWLIKELDFEKVDDENLFQLEHAACVLGRLDAGRALVKSAKDKPEVAEALAAAWKREKSPPANEQMCELICDGEETFRAALIEAGHDAEARVRVAAIAGLAKLKHDDKAEKSFAPPWAIPKKRTEHAATPCAAWSAGKSKTPTSCWLRPSVSADHHSIAATALELMLETPGAKSRELACALQQVWSAARPAIQGHRGIRAASPKTIRSLQDVLVELADDHDRSVRFQAWNAVRAPQSQKGLAGSGGPARS